MKIPEIPYKNLYYYFVFYEETYIGKDVEVFIDDYTEVEQFVTRKKKDSDFEIICIVKGKLVDIKPTQMETCWKIQE